MNCRSTTDIGAAVTPAKCNARAACAPFVISTSLVSKMASGFAFACVWLAIGSAFGSTAIQRWTICSRSKPIESQNDRGECSQAVRSLCKATIRAVALPTGGSPFGCYPMMRIPPIGNVHRARIRLEGWPDGSAGRFHMPVIDFHVHLRGGMTVEKAIDRQAVTGINVGVLRNLGKGWPLETDDQLQEFLDNVDGKPVFVGLQVNDRDWYTKHSSELLKRLDFVLGDTMIMPMPDDDSPPVKLFEPDQYTIDNAEAWMERYVQHNLRVLAEPITILANPTWLPPAWRTNTISCGPTSVCGRSFKRLSTIAWHWKSTPAADTRETALFAWPKMGAKFTFGSNNFDDRPIDMSRCLEAIEKYDLSPNDMYVPNPFPTGKCDTGHDASESERCHLRWISRHETVYR